MAIAHLYVRYVLYHLYYVYIIMCTFYTSGSKIGVPIVQSALPKRACGEVRPAKFIFCNVKKLVTMYVMYIAEKRIKKTCTLFTM